MRALFKAVTVTALISLLTIGAFLFPMEMALAQAAASSAADAGSVVTIGVADTLNPLLDTADKLGVLGVLIAFAIGAIPILRPLVQQVGQAALAQFINQAIGYAIQEVEQFDKDKVISFDVGSAGVASALRYIRDQVPPFLIKLGGGENAIISTIVSYLAHWGIVLDTGVAPAQVESAAKKLA